MATLLVGIAAWYITKSRLPETEIQAAVTLAQINDKPHASFEFVYDAEAAAQQPKPEEADLSVKAEKKPSVEEEVARLNEKVRDWVYVLPTYKANLLTKTLNDLTAPKEEPKEKPKEKEEPLQGKDTPSRP